MEVFIYYIIMKDMNRTGINSLMTLSEVAEYLKLSERTVLRLVHKNDIPGSKVGNQWRFSRSVIDDWLLANIGNSNTEMAGNNKKYLISEFLNPEYILLDIKPGDKETIFKQLLEPFVRNKIITNPLLSINKLMYREQINSTGIGNGIAFPHIRNPKENSPDLQPIVVGICKEGTDFNSVDLIPVTLFFLLCTNKESVHLNIMSRLGYLLRNESLKNALINVSTGEDFIKILKKNEIPKETNYEIE